ncbi:MAG: hypothetical protein FWC58_06085, partial [Desulfobulbus sp.]|nr:hypothetical protein [Desulfobulbus sp.]
PPTSEKTVKGNQGKTLKTSTWQLHFTSNETYKITARRFAPGKDGFSVLRHPSSEQRSAAQR